MRQFADKDKLVLAGSGCESTAQTIALTVAMAQAGADAAVVVTPCYFKAKMKANELKFHYEAVASASPIPIVLYSVPANTGIDLPADIVKELAAHPNIVGMKESGGDVAKIGRMVYETRNEDFQILAGSASFLLPALHVGAVGGICALANALPSECAQLQQLYEAGRNEEAVALQHRLIAPNAAVTKDFGVPGLKAALEWFGYYGGPCRKPLLPLDNNELVKLKGSFADQGFKC